MQVSDTLVKARRAQLLATAAAALGCLLHTRALAQAALLGGALITLHLSLLLMVARYCKKTPARHSFVALALLLFVKFVVMAAVAATVVLMLRPDAAGFVVGMSTFIVGLAVAATGHRKNSSPQDALCGPRF